MENLVSPAFWRGRRVFVTGHTGFKGGWLSLWLQSMGADVCGFALPPAAAPALFHVADVERGMHSVLGDVRDYERLRQALAAARPEIVLHLAAQPLVPYSYAEPVETFSTNAMGTVNLLEACRHQPDLKAVVVVSSDKCYENREQLWGYRETDPMGGHDPYSASKGCTELVVASYRRSFLAARGVALASARAGNVIGGGDWTPSRLVPDVLAAFARNEAVVLRNPDAIRPWQHVLEPWRVICSWPSTSSSMERPSPRAGTLGPTKPTRVQSRGSWRCLPPAGAPVPPGSHPASRGSMRRTPSSWTAPRPASGWAGGLAGKPKTQSPAASPGIKPGVPVPICIDTLSTKSPHSQPAHEPDPQDPHARC